MCEIDAAGNVQPKGIRIDLVKRLSHLIEQTRFSVYSSGKDVDLSFNQRGNSPLPCNLPDFRFRKTVPRQKRIEYD